MDISLVMDDISSVANLSHEEDEDTSMISMSITSAYMPIGVQCCCTYILSHAIDIMRQKPVNI